MGNGGLRVPGVAGPDRAVGSQLTDYRGWLMYGELGDFELFRLRQRDRARGIRQQYGYADDDGPLHPDDYDEFVEEFEELDDDDFDDDNDYQSSYLDDDDD